MSFYCKTCETFHEHFPLDLAFQKPDEYFEIAKDEVNQRIWLNDAFNADICMIDNYKFFIRGILPFPIIDTNDKFRFGIWVQVKEENCKRYYELWETNDASKEPSFDGVISNKLPHFEQSRGLAVTIKFQSNNQRPLFYLDTPKQDISIKQKTGVTMDEVHNFLKGQVKL